MFNAYERMHYGDRYSFSFHPAELAHRPHVHIITTNEKTIAATNDPTKRHRKDKLGPVAFCRAELSRGGLVRRTKAIRYVIRKKISPMIIAGLANRYCVIAR